MNKEELIHYGVKGQKWGIRKYQYEDGSLTTEGKKRYRKGEDAKEDLKFYKKVSVNKNTSKAALQAKKFKDRYTDDELRQIVNRFDLEKRLDDHAREAEREKISYKVKKWTVKTVDNLVSKEATNIVTSLFNRMIDRIEKK